jgi:uncharacterized membrane protein YdbT with pleckstrin-like domain
MPRHLMEGETIVLPTIHRHWILFVQRVVPASLLAILALLILYLAARGVVVRALGTTAVGLALGLWILIVWIQWWYAATLTLTDQRVLLERGIFVRRSKVIPLDRVQDASTRQGVIGRVLNYGDIEIDAAGPRGAELFDHAAAPEVVRDQVLILSDQMRRR